MKFYETKLNGAFIIELEKNEDERGFFARTWDKKEMQEFGFNTNLVQCNVSFNKIKGTLRGMHYQIAPYQEAKFVRCTRGKIFDVIIDLRPNSQTFKQWFSTEIDEKNHKMIYVPECFAHGFQTLEDNTEIFYQMSEYYMPEYAKGIRWDEKTFDIKWPINPKIISEKDLTYPSFNDQTINKI
jgi:dTDP-4-dehydrorhamnose 3,5-epimerase